MHAYESSNAFTVIERREKSKLGAGGGGGDSVTVTEKGEKGGSTGDMQIFLPVFALEWPWGQCLSYDGGSCQSFHGEKHSC